MFVFAELIVYKIVQQNKALLISMNSNSSLKTNWIY